MGEIEIRYGQWVSDHALIAVAADISAALAASSAQPPPT